MKTPLIRSKINKATDRAEGYYVRFIDDEGTSRPCYIPILEQAEFISRAVNGYETVLNALIIALPYIESARENQAYTPTTAVVDKVVKYVRDTIIEASKAHVA